MEISSYDDTLPLPTEVEREFFDKAGEDLTARAWLANHDIDPVPITASVGKIALIQYWNVWNPDTGRYRFRIYAPDHVGPKYPPELAIPIIEDGEFIDLCVLATSSRLRVSRAVHHGWAAKTFRQIQSDSTSILWIGLNRVAPAFVMSSRLAERRCAN